MIDKILTPEEEKGIVAGFVRDYFRTEPVGEYIAGVAISTVRQQDPTANEGLDDRCLVVYLKESLPEDIGTKLPQKYEGLNVYTLVTGAFTWP